MSELAVEGFRAEREAILSVAKDLSADEWTMPSACAGWTVRDVMGHMACTLHGVIDPAFLPDMAGGTESSMEPAVAERRSWPIEQVIDEYETYSGQAADLFESVQAAPLVGNDAADGRPRHAPDVDPAEHVLVRRLHAPAQRHAHAERFDRSSATGARREAAAPDHGLDARGPAVDVCGRARAGRRPPDRARARRSRRWYVDDRARRRRRPGRRAREHATETSSRPCTAPITTS